MQGILLCLLPFLLAPQQFYELRCFVTMWSNLNGYHPPATSLHSFGPSYYNHTRLVEWNVQRVLIYIQRR